MGDKAVSYPGGVGCRIIPHRALVEPKVSVASSGEADGEAMAVLRIEGLLCSACAANVRARLERLEGVTSAEVDLERGEARVRYDPSAVSTSDLVTAVEGAVVLRPARRALASLARPFSSPGRH